MVSTLENRKRGVKSFIFTLYKYFKDDYISVCYFNKPWVLILRQYVLKYTYFKTATELDLHGDVPETPNQYKIVLIDGAVYHLYMMRDNVELASLSKKLFTDGIEKMRQILINRYIRIRDTRVSNVINDW